MQFQIKKLLIWPKTKSLGPRVVDFKLGRVNIISGESKRGKSAIIPIIDYCLGSSKCLIPPGPIRNCSEWFGLVIQTTDGQLLIARKEPGTSKSSSKMYFESDEVISIPHSITEHNSNTETVKSKINNMAQLSNLRISLEEEEGYSNRTSYRDLMAFCFQPQNIIANPQALFYGTDLVEHRERLRRIFPFALGAIDADLLLKRWQLYELETDKRRLAQAVTRLQKERNQNTEILRILYYEAIELDLIEPTALAPISVDDYVSNLSEILNVKIEYSVGTDRAYDKIISEIRRLDDQEAIQSDEISTLTTRKERLELLYDNSLKFDKSVDTHKDRLGLAKWLNLKRKKDSTCPICDNPMHYQNSKLEGLYSALLEIEDISSKPVIIPVEYDKELIVTNEKLGTSKKEIIRIRTLQNSLESRHQQLKKDRFIRMKIDRFLGRLERSLISYEEDQQLSEIMEEIAELDEKIDSLKKIVSESAIELRTNEQKLKVEKNIKKLISDTDAEFKNARVEILVNELSLSISTEENTYHLSELGSGANWLSYHLTSALAFQQHFVEQQFSPIPNFLIFDQPSQVYFPTQLGDEIIKDRLGKAKDKDVSTVKQIFELMAATNAISTKRLQIIVLEHVPEKVWGEIDNVHKVEDHWRENGDALIPENWTQQDGKIS